MRKSQKSGDLTVQVIAGSYVVLFGMSLPKNKISKFLGFAIKRTDIQTSETIWMRGMKTFEATDPNDSIGANFSSREHPFQSFQWADYSAYPDCNYSYTIIALRGTPTNLKESETVTIKVKTESEVTDTHAIHFNRGAAASQEYARRFQNKKPSVIGDAAYNWLSRGLVEALKDFIGQAKDSSYGLFCAVYEFNYASVLDALKQAKQSGATVKIVYHAADDDTKEETEKAIAKAAIKSLCKPRKNTQKLNHNKFFVLTENGKPRQVFFGSTNISENGIFGHSNVGHIIRDASVAEAYYEYWKQLNADLVGEDMKAWTEKFNPAPPPDDNYPELFPVFSPHKGLKALQWYAQLANTATGALFMTFAFGMNKEFLSVYQQNDKVLRLALMDKKGVNKKGIAEIDKVRRLPNCVVAVGNNIKADSFKRWLKELYSIVKSPHVPFIHNKFMLVDPMGETPVVITGSANFSDSSTNLNDENMVVIRNNKRVADIYLGEYMRMYSHYAFAESLTFKPDNDINRSHLIPDNSWANDYYGNTSRAMRRRYFAGVED